MMTSAIIPARMGSSRFPGKPLALLHGIPMIGHVYFRARLNRQLHGVYIATCDEVIASYAASIGAPCIMTSAAHVRASDRTAEAAAILEAASGVRPEVVLMIQGDEPMLHPEMIDEALAPLASDPSVPVANLMAPLDADAAADPNEIKVVVDRRGDALYFSRQPVPWHRRGAALELFKQVCVIPFRRAFLTTFAGLEPTPLETVESIDMLRALEHGYRVRMARTAHVTCSVDTPADLGSVSSLMESDPVLRLYAEGVAPGAALTQPSG
jgi:3-deoxy-manno-octulosonate cytidylyltransferase (CMP-KDO synthetase)